MKLKHQIYRRRYWCLAALIVFLLEMAIFMWPVGLLQEDVVNFLTGEGFYNMKRQDGIFTCCQEFKPEYNHLESIGIFVSNDEELSGGYAVITISDTKRNVLFEVNIPYEEISLNTYTDIKIEPSINRSGQRCYLNIYLGADENGKIPVLAAVSTDYYMPENVALEQEGKLPDVQLATRYSYKDVLTKQKVVRLFCICVITALGIAIGLPHNKRFRKIMGALLLAAIPWILGRRLELLSIGTQFLLPFSMKWNMALMYLLELILLLCTQSLRFSICSSSLLLTLVYSANYFVFSFRGQPLRLNELTAIGTAAKVVDHYNLRPNSHMAMAWCICAFFVVYGAQTGFRWKARNKIKEAAIRLTSLIMGIALTVVSGYYLLYTDMLVKAGFLYTHGFDQNMNYHFNGYLVASFMDIQDSRIEKPQNYSLRRVQELLEDAVENRETTGNEIHPHIILIMNESFSDLRVLGNLQLSKDNLTFFHSLTDNTVSGYVNASVLGGGTANSEFEVFTGCNMGFLPPSYYPYQQCMVNETSSLISNLKDVGYTTYSMHPETAANWTRDKIYQYFGFDNSLWIEDFSEAERLHFGVTDLETYKKVEEIYENRQPEERLFIFDLTIQNHGGYSSPDGELLVKAQNVSSEEADNYLSLIQNSDEAFQQLITYFEKEEEPVIICMFGDHQPYLDDSFYEDVFNQTQGLEEKDKTLNMYKTPFLIWANYDIPEQQGLDIGMSYLGAVLLDIAGIQGSPFFDFLRQYMEEYPIITINGYEDKEGNHYNWSEEKSELMDYRILQYNHLFDRQIVEWGF